MNRIRFRDNLEIVGGQLNSLRLDLLEHGFTFTAGIIRAAEEAVLVAFNLFVDLNVGDNEL